MVETFDTKDNIVVKDNLSGVIKKYTESKSVKYPMCILNCDKIEKYKVGVIKSLTSFEVEEPIYIYLSIKGSLLAVGKIDRKKLRIMLNTSVLKDINKEIRVSENDILVGDMMYTLCT